MCLHILNNHNKPDGLCSGNNFAPLGNEAKTGKAASNHAYIGNCLTFPLLTQAVPLINNKDICFGFLYIAVQLCGYSSASVLFVCFRVDVLMACTCVCVQYTFVVSVVLEVSLPLLLRPHVLFASCLILLSWYVYIVAFRRWHLYIISFAHYYFECSFGGIGGMWGCCYFILRFYCSFIHWVNNIT